jgi:hypothetical protein
VRAYEIQLLDHAKAIRKLLEAEIDQILNDAVTVIRRRMASVAGRKTPSVEELRADLKKELIKTAEKQPEVSYRYKDVTYEHTKDPTFNDAVRKAVPATVRRKLGAWTAEFDAAQEKQQK